MGRFLTLIFAILTLGLIAAGTVHKSSTAPASTPDGAVQSMFANAKSHDWTGAYSYVDASSHVDQDGFVRDLAGRNGSLRTYSQLDSVNTRVLHESDNEATVRTELTYATAFAQASCDPVVDATLITDPLPCAIMCGKDAREQKNVPFRLTAIIVFHVSSDVSTAVP